MRIEQLQTKAEEMYAKKGIARCRYNALYKIVSFWGMEKINDSSIFEKIEKDELRHFYEQYKGLF